MQLRFINNQPDSGIGEDIAIIHNFTTHSNYNQVLFSISRFMEAIGFDPMLVHETILVDPDQLEFADGVEEPGPEMGAPVAAESEKTLSYTDIMRQAKAKSDIDHTVQDDQKLTSFIQQINGNQDFARRVFKIFMEALETPV